MLIYQHFPTFMRFGQLSPYILTLEEQVSGGWALEGLRILKQPRKRRTSTRRYDIENFRWSIFDTAVADFGLNAESHYGGREEIAFLARRFVKDSPKAGPICHQKRENQTGEAGAAAKINQTIGIRGDEFGQLRAVENVPLP